MLKKRKLNFDSLLLEVKKYKTRKDFRTSDNSAYKSALAHDRSEELFSYLEDERKSWDSSSVCEEAGKYASRYDFQLGSGGAYRYAFRNKIMDDLFPDSAREKVIWCEASVKKEAEKYQHRSDFKNNASGAYKCAYQNGLLDQIFGCNYNTPSCDNDVVYIWKVSGIPVYKIGVTSSRLKDRRIKYVCRKGNLVCEEQHLFLVKDATLVERALLSYGRPFEFDVPFSGSTEFRNLTKQEYKDCLDLINGTQETPQTQEDN